MKQLLIITLVLLSTLANAQKKYAADKDTTIDGKRWIIKHYVAKYGTKWKEFEPVDTDINNLQYHRDKAFLYFDTLLWVQSRTYYCDSILEIFGWDKHFPCYDSVRYYMQYWNNLNYQKDEWLFMEGGKNVLSSFPEYPLSATQAAKLEAWLNRKR